MRCADVDERLEEFRLQILAAEEHQEMEEHLAACETCQEGMRRVEEVERRLRNDGPQAGEMSDHEARLGLDRARSRSAHSRGGFGTIPLAAALESAPQDLLSARSKRPRHGVLITGLAAAALLGVLAWLLSQPPPSGGPAHTAPDAPSSGDDVDRLVAELRSSSPLRREIAAFALRAYGGAALEKLEKANADPALIDACRGITPEDRATLKILKETRITVDMQNAPFFNVVDFMRETSQLNFHISGIEADQQIISFKVNDVPLDDALRLMLEPHGFCHRVRNGVVLITPLAEVKKRKEASNAPARSPVRITVDEKIVHESILALAENAPGERDKASAALLRLGFAAEPALWKTLDSASPELRGRASDVLRQLYDPQEKSQRSTADQKLDEMTLSMRFENAKFSEILTFMGESLRLPIVVIPEGVDMNRKVTFKSMDLLAKNCLKLLLAQFALDYRVVDGAILILDPGTPILRTPRRPIWTAPEETKRIEAVLEKISREDTIDIFRLCKTEDLGALLQASRALDGAAAARCRRAATLVAEDAHVWLIDQASGADLQKLTQAQATVLNTECTSVENATLDGLLSRCGLKHSLKVGVEHPVRAYGAAPLRVSALLKAVMRPQGCDFYMVDETLVIDTSANVRTAVEK